MLIENAKIQAELGFNTNIVRLKSQVKNIETALKLFQY